MPCLWLSHAWVRRFSLPWRQAPASSQGGQRLERWGTCSTLPIHGLPACSSLQECLSGSAGEGFTGPWVQDGEGLLQGEWGFRGEAHIPASCISPVSSLGDWCPGHANYAPAPCPYQELPREACQECWSKATEFKNLERVQHSRWDPKATLLITWFFHFKSGRVSHCFWSEADGKLCQLRLQFSAQPGWFGRWGVGVEQKCRSKNK